MSKRPDQSARRRAEHKLAKLHPDEFIFYFNQERWKEGMGPYLGPPEGAKHGTRSGYQKHLNDETKPCRSCTTAATTYTRDRKKARAERFD